MNILFIKKQIGHKLNVVRSSAFSSDSLLTKQTSGEEGRFPRPHPCRADLGAPLAGRGVPVLRFQPSRGRESVDSVGRVGQGPEEFSVVSSLVQTSDLTALPCSGPRCTKLPT